MKFLLVGINAKYIHSNPAIRSLKAYAGEENEKLIETAEYTINHAAQEILADLYRRKPDVIGFSCYIWNLRLSGSCLRILRGFCRIRIYGWEGRRFPSTGRSCLPHTQMSEASWPGRERKPSGSF